MFLFSTWHVLCLQNPPAVSVLQWYESITYQIIPQPSLMASFLSGQNIEIKPEIVGLGPHQPWPDIMRSDIYIENRNARLTEEVRL